jgi:hypothetical protein
VHVVVAGLGVSLVAGETVRVVALVGWGNLDAEGFVVVGCRCYGARVVNGLGEPYRSKVIGRIVLIRHDNT